jgi:phosphate transport system protein
MIRFDNHAFKGLDDALRQLYADLMAMGDGAKQLLTLLPRAIDSADAELFVQAKDIDKRVNDIEVRVDASVAAIINKFTVMGEDLRFILAAVKIASTQERAADKLKNCVKRLSRVGQPIEAQLQVELQQAVSALDAMLPLALGLVLDYTPEAAMQMLQHGAVVQKAYRTILIHLHAHQSSADDETHILLIAKNLEQTADMMVEIMKISHYVHLGTKYDKRANAS